MNRFRRTSIPNHATPQIILPATAPRIKRFAVEVNAKRTSNRCRVPARIYNNRLRGGKVIFVAANFEWN
jgi:hypothetical protein